MAPKGGAAHPMGACCAYGGWSCAQGLFRGTEVLAAGVRGLLAGPFADISKVLASAPVQNQAV